MKKVSLFCLTENELQAEAVSIELALEGFTHHDISILLPETPASRSGLLLASLADPGKPVTPGALGLLALASNVPLPGIGTLLARGPLVLSLRGDMDVQRALIEAGIPLEQAAWYMEKVMEGKVLIGVLVREGSPEEKVVSSIFIEAGAEAVFPLKEAAEARVF